MASDDIISEALTEAIGIIIADCRREWVRELETLRAERRALLSELRADLAEHKLATAPQTKLATVSRNKEKST